MIELKDFDIEQNIRFEILIKEETEKLESLNFLTFPFLTITLPIQNKRLILFLFLKKNI